ncbi:hypothetical protein ABZP36_003159 [Zizania latifolia]
MRFDEENPETCPANFGLQDKVVGSSSTAGSTTAATQSKPHLLVAHGGKGNTAFHEEASENFARNNSNQESAWPYHPNSQIISRESNKRAERDNRSYVPGRGS